MFLANMPFDITQDYLFNMLGDKGFEPVDVHIVKNQQGQSKGFGYVKFGSEDETRDVVSSL